MIKGAKIYPFNDFQANCIVLWDNNGNCAVFDPCFLGEEEKGILLKLFADEHLTPVKIFLTHGHFDHVYGAKELSAMYGIPIYLGAADRDMLSKQEEMLKGYKLPVPDVSFGTADAVDGDILEAGDMKFKVLATPGHTPGGVCYYCEEDKLLVSGDTLFAGTIGRTDLYGGDYDKLIDSIYTKLLVLDGDIDVLPGHGRHTTIADERMKNPFLMPFNEPLEEDESNER